MKNNFDYTGKNIFVGIDVHKKTYTFVAMCDGELIKKDTIPATPARLIGYLNKFFKNAHISSAYEAGFCGFHLHRALCEHGINNIVVHAASIEISARDRVKTDKRDATKVAVQLSAGRLRSIHVPDVKREEYRELTRLRDDLVRNRTQLGVKLKLKAHYYGLIDPSEDQKVSAKWIKELLKKEMSEGTRFFITNLAIRWEGLTDMIAEIKLRLEDQALEDRECELHYRSAPGIGPTAARVLANELGDMSQFSSERALFSYTGMTPSEYSSGEHRRQGHISKQGKPILRRFLVQCAWIAIRQDNDLDAIFQRIARRAGKKRAIVAVARRLVGRIRACFRAGKMYRHSGSTAEALGRSKVASAG